MRTSRKTAKFCDLALIADRRDTSMVVSVIVRG